MMAPRAWPAPARRVLVHLAPVAAFALALWAKRALLPAYLAAEPFSAILAVALLVVATDGARRVLREPAIVPWSLGTPLLAALVVLLFSTPLPYELAHHAERLPHPEGTVRPTALETAPTFERRHPVATAIFRYAPERDLVALTSDTVRAFADAGWTVETVRAPASDAPAEYGIVGATRGRFDVSCILGERGGWRDFDGPMTTIGCRLTV